MTWPPQRIIIAPANDAERAAVRRAQRALRLEPTGQMDEPTKAALRGLQALHKVPVTGVLDPAAVKLIDGLMWQPPEEG